jgi:IS1 family transposase
MDRISGSVLICLGLSILFWFAGFFPLAVILSHVVIAPYVTEGRLAFSVKHVLVLDKTTHTNEQPIPIFFGGKGTVGVAFGSEKNTAIYRWRIGDNDRWERVYRQHNHIPELWMINNLLREYIGDAKAIGNKSIGLAVDAYREIDGIKGRIRFRRENQRLHLDPQSRPFLADVKFDILRGGSGGDPVNYGLPDQDSKCREAKNHQPPFGPFEGCVPLWRAIVGFCGIVTGLAVLIGCLRRDHVVLGLCLGIGLGEAGTIVWLTGHYRCDEAKRENRNIDPHSGTIVLQKYLDNLYYCSTVMHMANVLNTDKQIAVIGALAEGSSIRSIERITGVHRDTIMRLGVKIGQGCAKMMDSKMQDLDCTYLQFDELWGFIGKKERHVSVDDNPELGDVWTFCAIDSETKLVPSFKVGKRTHATTTEFVQDVASRMRHRVQVSSDAMHLYVEAMELAFGSDVDYGQCVKVYAHDAAQHPERKYSAPHFASAYRRPITGNPEMELVSTSHVERLNATTRLHMRRLTRLTLAFSKKLENFEAAVGLHFAYYNFVKRHNTLRSTPAMAAGIERDFWSVGQLVEATA